MQHPNAFFENTFLKEVSRGACKSNSVAYSPCESVSGRDNSLPKSQDLGFTVLCGSLTICPRLDGEAGGQQQGSSFDDESNRTLELPVLEHRLLKSTTSEFHLRSTTMTQEHERQPLPTHCDEHPHDPSPTCHAEHPGTQAKRYLVQVWGDVEPILHGPYDTEEARFQQALLLACENYGCVFRLDAGNGEPYVESYSGNDLDACDSPGPCKDEHEWVVFSAELKEIGLGVRCVQCGAVGAVLDLSEQEWSEAYHARPAHPRWTDDSRVTARWLNPRSVEEDEDTQGEAAPSPQSEGRVA